jgi:hypothetical protein
MEAFSPPVALTVTAALLGALLAAIVPTCLYLYVEPRGRRQWAVAGDTPGTRKAPALVRLSAWLSFAVGQLALPWLLVPATCVALVYLQTKLGMVRPLGLGVTAAVGVAGLVESFLALRLLPLGVRLLSGDARACHVARSRARWNAIASVAILGGGVLLSWAMTTIPNFVHPWLRAALVWTALRPVMAYAAVCLVHALLLGRCAAALPEAKKSTSTKQ